MKAIDLPPGVDRSPQGLFVYLWGRVQTSFSRAVALEPNIAFGKAATDALALDDEADAFHELMALVPDRDADELEDARQLEAVGKMLRIMLAIDSAFYRIHPRHVVLSSSASTTSPIPPWLDELAEQRLLNGLYLQTDTQQLVARGPLQRKSRDITGVFAETLSERFAALTVVPSHLDLRGNQIKLVFRTIGFDSAVGVKAGRRSGSERIAFVPIAQAAGDVTIQPKHRDGQGFLDYRVPATLNAAERLVDALSKAGKLDVAMAPELVMREEHADEIPDRLAAAISADSRIVVAGSGQTKGERHGQSWNESRIFNASGSTLLRQRKLWPAAIDKARAGTYGVTDLGPTDMLLEDNARGDTLEVLDIDSLGRCVVLICQDFTERAFAASLVQHVQPDWIFVPILDAGIDPGRWVHQHAFALSGESPGRYLVCSSTSLGAFAGKHPLECGMAIGALDAADGDRGRLFHICHSDAAVTPHFTIVEWNLAKWEVSKLAAS